MMSGAQPRGPLWRMRRRHGGIAPLWFSLLGVFLTAGAFVAAVLIAVVAVKPRTAWPQ